MTHTVFAVFSDHESAEKAARQLVTDGLASTDELSVLIHSGDDPSRFHMAVQNESDLSKTDVGPSTIKGALLGGVIGGVVAGPFGLIGGGPLIAALFGATAGSLYGALASGLMGVGLTDHSLNQLTKDLHDGDTLLTVHTDTREREQKIERFLSEQNARLIEKRAV